jgi:undecaprenyl-diphosphatase
MWVVQLWGVTGTAVVIGLIALWRRRTRLGVALIALVPLKLIVERLVVKNLVHRERPGSTVSDAILRDAAPTGLSFPSGHAMIAFGIATLLTPYLRSRGRAVVWTLAVLNNVSRIYLGAHNPLDVVCGAALGVFLGCVLTWIVGIPSKPAKAPALKTPAAQAPAGTTPAAVPTLIAVPAKPAPVAVPAEPAPVAVSAETAPASSRETPS